MTSQFHIKIKLHIFIALKNPMKSLCKMFTPRIRDIWITTSYLTSFSWNYFCDYFFVN